MIKEGRAVVFQYTESSVIVHIERGSFIETVDIVVRVEAFSVPHAVSLHLYQEREQHLQVQQTACLQVTLQ